jgi:hypothetical protein
MKRQRSIPAFVSSTTFFQSARIHFNLGLRLIERGVLQPAALCNGRPLFPAAQAKAAVTVYKLEKNRAQQNIRQLTHSHV